MAAIFVGLRGQGYPPYGPFWTVRTYGTKIVRRKKKRTGKKNGVCEENSRNPTYDSTVRRNGASHTPKPFQFLVIYDSYCPMVIFFSKILTLSHFIAKHGR